MKNKAARKISLLVISLSILLIIVVAVIFSIKIFSKNVKLGDSEGQYFYISSGSDYDDVCNALFKQDLIKNKKSFLWLANKKNYPRHVKAGRYLITGDMTNNKLINMLRSGKQEPLNLVINNIRTKQQLAGLVSSYLEADSNSIINLLNDTQFIGIHGFTRDDVMTIFIPNTYEFFWNTSAKGFFMRMLKEYDRFWTDARLQKAMNVSLSKKEISILASIVQQETTKTDEMPDIAGVYINRLKKGIPLQADPTIIFALGDFTKKRVLKRDINIDSPYNTYKNRGLPPGPICLPEPATIDNVLNYKRHNYYYFCAKDDMSGYHNFSKTLREHLRHARLYQRSLNKRKIRK